MECNVEPKDKIATFECHGVIFSRRSSSQAQGECPFCGKENHFYVRKESGQWDCKSCGLEGNIPLFLEGIVEQAKTLTEDADYKRLVGLRRVPKSVYEASDVVWDGARWLIPFRSPQGHVQDIRYAVEPALRFRSTDGCKVGLLWCEDLLDPAKRSWPVWVCEGEWDGLALRWLFSKLKVKAVVVAVPGANTFKTDWINWFNDRHVILAYDADPAGDAAMLKVGAGRCDAAGRLEKPGLLAANTKTLKFIRWPLNLPEGWDIRDTVTKRGDAQAAWSTLQSFIAVKPRTLPLNPAKGDGQGNPPGNASEAAEGIVDDPVASKVGKLGKGGRPSFKALVAAYRQWLELSADHVGALKLSLAIVFSNQLQADPLWLYIVGPPGSGKTTMLNPMRDCDEWCVWRSNLGSKELVSGYPGNPDPSLLPLLDGKTLILKDMTELLSAPYSVQEEVFGTLRGAYDGHVERSYGNGVKRRYVVRFSMVAGVTNQIHGHDRANLGERCLKYQLIPQGKEDNTERQIMAALANIGRESDMGVALGDITAKFLDHTIDPQKLRDNVSKEAELRIVALAQLVATLRASVVRKQYTDEVSFRPQKEVATRLSIQLLKMAMLLTAVSGTDHLTNEDFALVERLAFDTAIGYSLDVVQAMTLTPEAMTSQDIAKAAELPQTNVARKLQDLIEMKVIKRVEKEQPGQRLPRVFYSLAPHVRKLWEQARVGQPHHKRTIMARRRRKLVQTIHMKGGAK